MALPSQRKKVVERSVVIEVKKEPLKLVGKYVNFNGDKYAFAYDKRKETYEYGPLGPLGQNVPFMPIKEKQIRTAIMFGAMKTRP